MRQREASAMGSARSVGTDALRERGRCGGGGEWGWLAAYLDAVDAGDGAEAFAEGGYGGAVLGLRGEYE